MLIVAFFGLTISAIVPEGPSSGISAESSTIVISPPPRAGAGSMFIAGLRSGIVWRDPPTVEASADSVFKCRIEAKKSLKTPAFAVDGNTVTTMTIRDIKETATRADPVELYFTPRRPLESARSSLFLLAISQIWTEAGLDCWN